MDQDTGMSVHKIFKMPKYSHPDYWGNEIGKQKSISKVYFLNYIQNPDFLSRAHSDEDSFYVLFVSKHYYDLMNSWFLLEENRSNYEKKIVEYNKSGRLKLICLTDRTGRRLAGRHSCSLPILIEMFKMTGQNVNVMYVISEGEKLIVSAKFIFKFLFDIDVRINSESSNISKTKNTDFFFRNDLANTYLEFYDKVIKKCIERQFVFFIDQDNIGLKRREIDDISEKDFVIICKNHCTMAGRTSDRSSTVPAIKPTCIEISNPIVEQCSDILIVLMMLHLDSVLQSNIIFMVRSRDTIFLLAKTYISKDSLREINLPDLE